MAMAPPTAQADEPYRDNLSNYMICPHCKTNPPNLVDEYAAGDVVCTDCGTVVAGRTVDTRSEWRTFSNDDQANDDPSRVGDGPNLLLNGDQLQTSIAFGDGSKSKDLFRAQNRTAQDKGNKALLEAYKEIGSMCENIHLSKSTADTTKHLFKQVSDAGVFRGKSQPTIIAGCIFIACRQTNVPRTFREIHALTQVPKKEIGRIFKALEKFFGQIDEKNNKETQQPPKAEQDSTSAHTLCIRYCSNLSLNHQATKVSIALAEKLPRVGALDGRSPISAAAACIYFASHLMKDPRSPKEISDVVNVSDGTIRTSYKLLEAVKEKLVEKEWLERGDMSLLPKA